MLKKRIFIGQINETKIYIHISLILSTILAWSVVTLITKPALGFNYGPFLYGSSALMAALAVLVVKVGYEVGRLLLLQNHNVSVNKLVLLPLSGLLIYEKEPARRSIGFWSSFMPTLPLIGIVAAFSALTLSPTAGEFQIVVLRGIALTIIFFIASRLFGAFAVDRLNTVYSLVWHATKNQKLANFIFEVWRNFSIVSILIAAVALSPTYRWLGVALATTIAWGLYEAVLYQRQSELNLRIKNFKAKARELRKRLPQNQSRESVLN